ncbi:MAG TPA: 4-diphosphocytidyl-2C-methyl-D-erythritol kinase [Rhizobium sp.]|nr:4-diphosphocytidyl-2C-methyl-D-erythritol kinase [Rhizobium sp.]
MIFGEFPLDEAQGTVLAHAIRLPDGRLSKGHRLGAADIERLRAAGTASVIACRMEAGDLPEDEAAQRLADAISRRHLRFTAAATGRVNIHATENGLFVADKECVDRFNRIDPAITLACLADHTAVLAGDLVATIKIIPLSAPAVSVDEGCSILSGSIPFEVKPYRGHSVTLIATELPSLKPAVMDKTARLLEQRLVPSQSRLVREVRVVHKAQAVAEAIRTALEEDVEGPRMVVVFGASAVCDPRDVIPEAIHLAGGHVEQVGLPVDPGNLLVLGSLGEVPVIGAPGCARSPKENGFDWVLSRIFAGEKPGRAELTGLGVGGLLMEIASRPMPRELPTGGPRKVAVAVVLLAAGKASRMGPSGPHKLLAEFDGEPLVRRMALSALSAEPDSIVVVTGHRSEEISGALSGLDVEISHNPDYANGMASSLRVGFAAEGARGADGILVMLADMPGVAASDLQALMEVFRASGGRAIVRAVSGGKRGNPVILPRSAFPAVMKLEGDVGARHIMETSGLEIIDVDIGPAAHIDVDTPEAVVAAGGILKG